MVGAARRSPAPPNSKAKPTRRGFKSTWSGRRSFLVLARARAVGGRGADEREAPARRGVREGRRLEAARGAGDVSRLLVGLDLGHDLLLGHHRREVDVRALGVLVLALAGEVAGAVAGVAHGVALEPAGGAAGCERRARGGAKPSRLGKASDAGPRGLKFVSARGELGSQAPQTSFLAAMSHIWPSYLPSA